MNNLSPVVFVGVKQIEPLPLGLFQAALGRLRPESTLAVSNSPADSTTTYSCGIKLGDREYTCFLIDSPIPAEELSVAVQTAYAWKGAASAVAQSVCHWIISPVGIAHEPADAHAMAKDVTVITTAMILVSSTEFVYWTAGDVLSSPPQFKEAANQMLFGGKLPVLCWTQIRLLPGAAFGLPGSFGAKTTGLSLFGKYELRVQPKFSSPQDAFRATMDLIAYILPEQANVNDRDSVELASGDVLVAHYVTHDGEQILEFTSYLEGAL